MIEYLNFKSKYKLLKKFSNVFSIKTGEVFKSDNGKCYKVTGWFSFFYKLYLILLSTELVLFLIFGLYILVENFIDIWWLNLMVCALIYIFIEVVFIAFIPLEKVPCWQKSLDDKKRKESGT